MFSEEELLQAPQFPLVKVSALEDILKQKRLKSAILVEEMNMQKAMDFSSGAIGVP